MVHCTLLYSTVVSFLCIYSDPSIFTVRLGDLNNELTDGTEQEFDVVTVVVHEEYSLYPSPRFDIALLRLRQKGGLCAR